MGRSLPIDHQSMMNGPALLLACWASLTLACCRASSDTAGARSASQSHADPTAGTVVYKGRTIVFDETTVPPLLSIDGKSIRVSGSRADRNPMYTTPLSAYAFYSSVWQLARALVDGKMIASTADRTVTGTSP